MPQMTSLFHHLKHSLLMSVFLSFVCCPCHAASTKAPNQSRIIKSIVEEATKEKDKRDTSRMKEITDFAYGKALEFAKANKEFAENVLLDDKKQNQRDNVEIEKFDDDTYLIAVPLFLHAYQRSGCLFLIHPSHPDWTPLQLEQRTLDEIGKSYSFIVDEIGYSAPLLSISSRSAGWYAGLRTEDTYVFKEGTFKLILSVATILDEKKAEGVDLNNEKIDVGDYVKTEIRYVDSSISQLYSQFAPPGKGGLEKADHWKNIHFVKNSKAYFHDKPDEKAKQTCYIIRGDAVYVSEVKGSWVFAHYSDLNTKKETSGWIKLGEVMKIGNLI